MTMAIKAKINTKGFDAYFERIRRAGLSIEGAADRAALAGGNVLKTGMRERVRKLTHNLEEHIDVEPVNNGTFRGVEVGLIHADAETARYGTVQEYGSSSVSPQSFVRATVDEDMTAARRAMRDSLKREGVVE